MIERPVGRAHSGEDSTGSGAGEGNIYLSPHHDDIAFSLGAFAAAHPGGTLVNLFTRSAYFKGASIADPPDQAEVERVTRMRRAEDEAFAARLELRRLDLALMEPALRGRASWDAAGVGDDVSQLRGPLLECLDELLLRGEPSRRLQLFCPIGIGGHANHLATRAVILENLEALERRARVLFYEDLHYAGRGSVRRAGLRNLRDSVPERRMVRQTWRIGAAAAAAKLAAANLYRSQFKEPLKRLASGYSPATLWPPGPHEAFWELLR